MRRVLSPNTNTNASTNASTSASPDTSLTTLLVGFLVLNPMVPFMSSGINPDAVNVPLATLSILLVWQVMSTGTGARLACLALVATALTKPSGLQMIPAFAAAGAALWALGQHHVRTPAPRGRHHRRRRRHRLVRVLRLVSPTLRRRPAHRRSLDHLPDDAMAGTAVDVADLLGHARMAGILGAGDLVSPAGGAHRHQPDLRPAAPAPHTPRLFAGYAAIFLVAFLAVTLAGEFFYLPTAGYFLQGRHLLPASLGLAGLMWHRVRPVKFAFLAVLIAMNVLLLHQTVMRYYTRGWTAVVSALPFAGDPPPRTSPR